MRSLPCYSLLLLWGLGGLLLLQPHGPLLHYRACTVFIFFALKVEYVCSSFTTCGYDKIGLGHGAISKG